MHQLVGSFFNRHAVEERSFYFRSRFDLGLPQGRTLGPIENKMNAPLRLLVDIWFQFYFTPLTGVLFTFPSRYLFTIDLKKYVALPVSSGEFTRAFRVSSYSRTTAIESHRFRVRDYYPLESRFPARSTTYAIFYSTCCQRCNLITPIYSIARRNCSRSAIE